MTGATLHIFNPDTDFALGYDGDNFTPKANIISLRRRLALLPLFMGSSRRRHPAA